MPPVEEIDTIPIRFGAFLGPVEYNKTADINLGVWVRFRGTLVAGKEATVDATGYLNSTEAKNRVELVDVFFKLSVAVPIQNDSNGLPTETRVELSRYLFVGPILIEENTAHLTWPNPGDYAPTVAIVFFDHTETHADIPYVTVHVEPTSQLQTESLNRINMALTYALVAFGIIEITLGGSEYVEGYLEAKTSVPKSPPKPDRESEPLPR